MYELELRVGEALVEPVSDLLADELGALAVSVEDADAGRPDEKALFGEPGLPVPPAAWARSSIRALFSNERSATQAATLLLAQNWAGHVHIEAQREVPDTDWVRATQSQFGPVEITPTFWIVPSWHRAPLAATHVLKLDPGLAFGTGTHPTTRMCLRWIAARGRPWPRVLDYGCGSGVLAIAAAMHGARHVDAVDIDPAALTSARANAQSNQVNIRVGPPDVASGRYDVILANILARPLALLAPLLASHLATDGALVLAGILDQQAEELRNAYAPWCKLNVSARDEGWILMTGEAAA
jgi:ribosomal protein L11 methyltransferase